MSSTPKLTPDQQEFALQVNSLLMAVHLWDGDLVDQIVKSAEEEAGSLLFGAIVFLKETLDNILEVVNECDALDVQFTFEDLVRSSTKSVIESEKDD